MTETKLKPCPFCGYKEIIDDEDDGITCANCGAYIDGLSVEDDACLADVWNTRPIESKLKSDNVKLIMTNKLLKKRVERLESALQAIMDATEQDEPSLEGISLIAYMALEKEEDD